MPIMRAQVILASDNGLPEDACVNVFHFSGPGDFTLAPLQDDLIARIRSFYNDVGDGGSNVAGMLGSTVKPESCRIKLYELVGAPPHPPIRDEPLNLAGVGSAQLPREVALVLSFQGDPISGVVQARRRGRVFIGPLTTSVTDDENDSRPTLQRRTDLNSAGKRLMDANTNDVNWVVRSTVSQLVTRVDNGWVDNAFDTQRRRGSKATSRLTFT
jgi:hypothetical protein